ncbi:MAG TPA: hypothetical protein VGO45_13290 [Bacteroidia bacterium]|nr:hypothetical protein [Bacteroidia bacterium]
MIKRLFFVVAFLCSMECARGQDIALLKDSLSLKTLQDSFCACVGRHAGEGSKDWGDAIALALFAKLDINSSAYRNAELFLSRQNPSVSMRSQDNALDSLIIEQSFVKCVSLWSVILKDRPGFFKTIAGMREHPPLLQVQIPHLREQTGKNLLSYLKNGVSDSIAVLFDRRATFDSSRASLEKVSREIKGQVVTEEMTFERRGRDTCGTGKMKLLKGGIVPLGGFRISYKKGDVHAKIEKLDLMLRDSFLPEDLIGSPAPEKKKK